MKNLAVKKMVEVQFPNATQVNVVFTHSIKNIYHFHIEVWDGDVRENYELKVENTFICRDNFA